MSGIDYLLDTCFILELHKRNEEVLQIIHNKDIQRPQCAISVINRLEVLGYANMTADDELHLPNVLAGFEKIPLDLSIENTVIDLRKRHKIKLPDAIILATALNYRLELLSLDSNLMHKYHQESKLS